jgi:hypothetical protein
MSGAGPRPTSGRSLLIGFVAGVLSVAVFHQAAVFVVASVGWGEGTVYSFRPTAPLGVPRLISQMFWGGLWGVLFAALIDRMPRRWPLVAAGLVYGITGPTLFAILVVTPLRGSAITAALAPQPLMTNLVTNGAYGIGLAILFARLCRLAFGTVRPPA